MLLNLVILGSVVRLLLNAAQIGRRRPLLTVAYGTPILTVYGSLPSAGSAKTSPWSRAVRPRREAARLIQSYLSTPPAQLQPVLAS